MSQGWERALLVLLSFLLGSYWGYCIGYARAQRKALDEWKRRLKEENAVVKGQLLALWDQKSLALAEKVDAVVGLVRNLEADAQAFKAERDHFAEKARLVEAKLERIKGLVRWVAAETGQDKFQGGKFSIGVGKATQRPTVPDAKFLPEDMREAVTTWKTLWDPIRASVKAGVYRLVWR